MRCGLIVITMDLLCRECCLNLGAAFGKVSTSTQYQLQSGLLWGHAFPGTRPTLHQASFEAPGITPTASQSAFFPNRPPSLTMRPAVGGPSCTGPPRLFSFKNGLWIRIISVVKQMHGNCAFRFQTKYSKIPCICLN